MASKETNIEDLQDAKGNAGGVGALLKASRLRLGDDLRYVAETLHIRFIYLEAIEAGRYDELPGPTYATGFIRSYADYLGLDSGEVVRRYKAESTGGSAETRLVFPVPVPESSIPGGAIIFIGVVVALLTYGVWYVSTAKDGFLAGLVSQVPERLNENKQGEEPEMKSEPVAPENAEKTGEPVPKIVVEVADKEDAAEAAAQMPAETEPETEAPEMTPPSVVQVVPVTETTPEVTPQSIAESTVAVTEEASPVSQVAEEVQQDQGAQEIQQAPQAVVVEAETATQTVVEKVEATAEVTPTQPVESSIQSVVETVQAEEPSVPTPAVSETAPAETVPAEVPEPSTIVQAIAEAPVEVSPSETVDSAAEPVASVAPTPTPTEAATETASAPTPTPSSTSAHVYGAENANSRILVKARKNSWIQVRDTNANRLLLTRLLRAGDSYRVPDQPGLVLLTGNAGALEILVDGETVPDLGEAGKVRRNVAMDPDLLRQGAAAN